MEVLAVSTIWMKFFEYSYNHQVILHGSNPAVEKIDSLGSHGLWLKLQYNWAPHLPAVLPQPGLSEEAMVGNNLCHPGAVQFRARPLNRCVCLTTTCSARSQVRTMFYWWGGQGYWQVLHNSHRRSLFLIHMAWLLGSKLLGCAGMQSPFNQVTDAAFLLFKNSGLVVN